MKVMAESAGTSNSGLGLRRNTLLSTFDILFEENPKEWIGFKPALGLKVYPCYACRHMFSSIRSFQDHVNRRAIVLKYNCSGCSNEILTYYNRCSFLLHCRTHFNLDQGEIDLYELGIFTLPVSLAGFLPHPNIPLLFDEEEEPLDENVYSNSQFYSPNYSQRGSQRVLLKPNDLIFKQSTGALALKQICANIPKCEFITAEQQKQLRNQALISVTNNNDAGEVEIKQEVEDEIMEYTIPVISKVESLQDKRFKLPKCLDCDTYQKGTMAEHYLGKNKPIDNRLKCGTCRFVASTKCSLKAHIRIHGTLPPYVCPDCGKDFPNSDDLADHMEDVCFHLAKHVRFRCPGKKCGKLFAVSATFAAHFKVHLKCFYTCSLCSDVFFNEEEASTHTRGHEAPCALKRIFDCAMCSGAGHLTEENYKSHINMHTTDTRDCMYVYLCKHCRSYFRSTLTYATHLLKCNKQKQPPPVVVKKATVKYITRNCERCHNKIIFNPQTPTKLCSRCKQMERSKHPAAKRYFCILCNKQITLQEKSSHMRMCRYSKPFVEVVKLDADDLESKSYTSNSSDFDSTSTPTKCDRVKRYKSSDSSRTDDSIKRKRKRVGFFPNHSRHKKAEKDNEPDLTAEDPMKFNGVYHCKLCSYENTERLEFHAHIKEHRDISTAYQCMECAECFVVKPSLMKHLLHFHNISDYESYLRHNDCFDVEAVKELEEIMRLAPGESKEPVKENQCRVCRQEFGDAMSLNKHFRIHGMAFLMRNAK